MLWLASFLAGVFCTSLGIIVGYIAAEKHAKNKYYWTWSEQIRRENMAFRRGYIAGQYSMLGKSVIHMPWKELK